MSSRVQLTKGSFYKLEGPASIKLIEGLLSVLGKYIKPRELLTVPRSKALPLEVLEDSVAELKVGPEASFDPLPSHPIPREWAIAAEKVIEAGGSLRVVVLGDVDSGKATFCTFLANKLVEAGLKVGVLDCDPGQAEVFVPTTIALGAIKSPVTGIDKASLIASYFIGATSPSGLVDRVLMGARALMERARSEGLDALVVNTSGWTTGRGARMLKQGLINAVSPSHVVLIQRGTEVEHLVKPYAARKGGEVLRIPVSSFTRSRSKVDRRVRRESAFKGYFTKAKVKKFSLDSVGLAYTLLNTGFRMTKERLAEVEEVLGQRVVYGEESPDAVFVVVERPLQSVAEATALLKERLGKEEALITHPGAERGLIAALLDGSSNMLGLGLIEEVDYEERTISVLTPVEVPVSLIQVGQLKLDEECRETAKIEGWPL